MKILFINLLFIWPTQKLSALKSLNFKIRKYFIAHIFYLPVDIMTRIFNHTIDNNNKGFFFC